MAVSKSLYGHLIEYIATICIIYQVYRQLYSFMEYPVSSELTFKQTNIRLPAVTFCVSYWYSEFEETVASRPLGQLRHLVPTWNQSVIDCSVTLPNFSTVPCTSVSQIHRYMNTYMVCFSLFEGNLTLATDRELRYTGPLVENNLFKVDLKSPFNYSNHWALVLRPHNAPLSIFRSTESKMWIEPMVNKAIWAKFKIIDRIELPPPYPSQCTVYGKQLQDSDNAVQQCWLEQIDTKFWPRWTLYDFNYNYSQEMNSRYFASKKFESSVFSLISEKCFRKYPECQRYFMVLSEVKSEPINVPLRESNLTFGVINIPKSTETISLVPKEELIALINDIGSILSMWIGIALYLSSLSLVDFSSKRSTKRLSKSIIRTSLHARMSMAKARQSVICVQNKPEAVKASKIFYLANSIIYLVTLLFTLNLVTDIIMIYFQNPFYTLMIFSRTGTVQLSHLTTCFDFIIDRNKLTPDERQKYKNVSDENLIQDFTIDQLINLTIDWNTFFVKNESSFLSSETLHREQIDEFFRFSKSFKGERVCFSTFGQDEYKSGEQISPYSRSVMFTSKSIDVKLNLSSITNFKTREVDVYYHFSDFFNEDSAGNDRVTISVNERKELFVNSYVMRPSQVEVALFSDHISSSCRDYEKNFGFKTRLELVENCTLKNFLSNSTGWPSEYRVKSSKLKFSGPGEEGKLKRIREKCEAKFPHPDCTSVYQYLEVIDKFYHPKYMSIIIYPPKKFVCEYQQHLRYSVVDLVGLTGATFSTWIGFAIVDILIFLPKLKSYLNSVTKKVGFKFPFK